MKIPCRLLQFFSALTLLLASCSYTLVATRSATLVPTTPGNRNLEAAIQQSRPKLEEILRGIAEDHGMVPCGHLDPPDLEVAMYAVGGGPAVYRDPILKVFQLERGFYFEIKARDPGALLKAKETPGMRLVWSELMQRLEEEWPGCVREQND